MKKAISVLLALLLALSVTACSETNDEEMSIQPSEFSEETLEVLELFDDEIQFFDISYEPSAKYQKLSVWVYRDGQWKEEGKVLGEPERVKEKIAVGLTETSCVLYGVDETGHCEYRYPELNTDFDKSMILTESKIDKKTSISLQKEIPLWVKVGTNANQIQPIDMENFKKSECDTGVAVTLTVSDQPFES